MGVIHRQGGSFLAWWRLNPDTPFTGLPQTGNNCREPYGIIRNYDNQTVVGRTRELLQRYADNDQCVIRTGLYTNTELSNGGTIHNINNGLNGFELNKLTMFLQDIKDAGFDLHFAIFPIGNDRPYTWNSFQQNKLVAHINLINQIRPIIRNIFAPGEYWLELHNEGQGAGNQPMMVRYAWELYRAYGNLYGVQDTTGSSIGYSAQSAGLSRYNIQYADYQDPNKGLYGLPTFLDIHGYDPFSGNGLLQLDQAMIANGDMRDIIIGETYYSSYTAHVSAVMNQIAQLSRDVHYVLQWPIDESRGCDGHVNRGSTHEFRYTGQDNCRSSSAFSCVESDWV